MNKIDRDIIYKEISNHKDEILEWAKTLIGFPSENHPPNGNEGEAQIFIEKECKSLGWETDTFTPDEVPNIKKHPLWLSHRDYSNNRKNVVACWKGIGDGKSILFSGHIDVVPSDSSNWKICHPYKPIIKNNKIYGRGSADMKGGIAASFWAMKILQKLGFKPKGNIIFETVVDEEYAGGNGTLASRLKGYNSDLAILTEPSNMQVCPACIGAFLGDFNIEYKVGGMPFLGVNIPNPINGASQVIKLFKEWEKKWRSLNSHIMFSDKGKELNVLLWCIDSKEKEEFFQIGTPTITKISWVIWCYPGMTEVNFYKQFKSFWEKHRQSNPGLKPFKLEITPSFHFVKPWETDISNPAVQQIIESFKKYNGKNPTVTGASISSDMAIHGEIGNIPTVIFGPSGGNFHTTDEWVSTEDIFSLIGTFILTVNQWCC